MERRDLIRVFVLVFLFPLLICYTKATAHSQALVGNDKYLEQKSGAVETKQGNISESDFYYIVGPGDRLNISVWRHPDLNKEVVVRPDGKIAFPIVNDIQASGLTPAELDANLVKGLSDIIRDPEVTVTILSFASKKIFVLGEVRRAGVYPFRGKMTVLEAISEAGSYTDDAVLRSTIIVRRGYTEKPEITRINLEKVIKKGDFRQNILLQPGDIIFVPKSFIAKIDTFIDHFFTRTYPAIRYYLDLTDPEHRYR